MSSDPEKPPMLWQPRNWHLWIRRSLSRRSPVETAQAEPETAEVSASKVRTKKDGSKISAQDEAKPLPESEPQMHSWLRLLTQSFDSRGSFYRATLGKDFEPTAFDITRFVAKSFIRRHGGLTVPTLLVLAWVAYLLGNQAYQNLQIYYQEQMFRAVADADVLADICASRQDMLWEDCLDPEQRGALSDRFAWVMLVSANVVDPLAVPTPAQLRSELRGKDKPAYAVYLWLKGELGDFKPQQQMGTGLLIQATTVCSTGFSGHQGQALPTVLNAYLGDLYQPLANSSRWFTPELRKALGWSQPISAMSATEAQVKLDDDVTNWLAPWDPRYRFGANGETALLDKTRAVIWKGIGPAAPGKAPTNIEEVARAEQQLTLYLSTSADRVAVPNHVADDDLVAMLLGIGGLLDAKGNAYIDNLDDCDELKEAIEGTNDTAVIRSTLSNFERMGMYIAGQIRVSPEVKQVRFWLNVYTGHEQRLILMVGVFGVLVVLARMSVFLALLAHRQPLVVQSWMAGAAGIIALVAILLVPVLWSLLFVWLFLCASFGLLASHLGYRERDVHQDDRDNDFDSLSSSRWPVRLVAAILPAIGFIGTVRGIMLSLNGADAIVWAETVNERSTAISTLSADLGLAFATTLLALLGGALLTLLMAIEMALGERLLLEQHYRRNQASDDG